ncbi:MAG: hypothetical protein E2576_19385 [Alcaligenaceae bacterium]|nr:hypothetical protein [Alcaligenaceae bacterium SAGV5]MPS52977.1 hypothetical protein [Alcaligenaceae bacterium SAGV3]MPT58887.1 hypothetical protein [Alcaligenaceae bacterium]
MANRHETLEVPGMKTNGLSSLYQRFNWTLGNKPAEADKPAPQPNEEADDISKSDQDKRDEDARQRDRLQSDGGGGD